MKNTLETSKRNKFAVNKRFYFVLLIAISCNFIYGQTRISSVSALAAAASRSNQNIVMTPGVYQMQDYLTPRVIRNTPKDAGGSSSMITFSGNNNTFDLTGVTIEVNTALLNDFRSKVKEFYVTGNNIKIKGLTVTDIGNSPTHSGGQSFAVDGKNNTIEKVTLNVRGSAPYGYGDLLGKGGPNLVPMQKHSGMLVVGLNINIIGCSIFSRSMGHLFFIQGGRNVLFKDCYAEAVTRRTNNMLAETSGPAFNLDFESVYRNRNGNKVITRNYTKSLSEVGYRSYGRGGVDGNTTGAITLINCKAKSTRSGFAFVRYGGDVLIQNCEAIGCEAGYQVEGVTIENSRGDAVNGPLIYLNGRASDVELELIPNVNTTTLHAIATIGGNNHKVTLKSNGSIRAKEHPILIGSTRPSGANPFSPLGTTSTSNLTLNNCTGMPVVIGRTASRNSIETNGKVNDKGSNNSVKISNDCLDQPSINTVSLRKRNASNFAIDGGNGGAVRQNIYLYSSNSRNVNQQWNEIDRGNGFYSYQKKNTNFCIDGNNGGSNGQNVFLATCGNNNLNQHWKKVNRGNGNFRLEKRNAPNYSLDGGNGGANRQNLKLWASNNANQNQQWTFGNVRETSNILERNTAIYTNSTTGVLNIDISEVETANVSIYNIIGQLINEQEIKTGTNSIALDNLDQGVYIVKINHDAETLVKKIIKD